MLILWIFPAWIADAQSMPEKAALSKLEKQKWKTVKTSLDKVLRKDTISAGAHYVMARYFFDPGNPDFNIDSAYRHAKSAFHDYLLMVTRQRERLKRIPLDSVILVDLTRKIDSAAFYRALVTNTEEGYLFFIEFFPHSEQYSKALELRNQVAYEHALGQNTHQAFAAFIKKYPDSRQAADAARYHDKLLYEFLTSDGSLDSYESFLKEFPRSPYRGDAEKQIFELSIATGKKEAFAHFIRKYPESIFNKKARDILYHLLQEPESDERYLEMIMTDSLRKLEQLNEGYLVPFFKNNLFGFMDRHGNEVIPAMSDELNTGYLCGNIVEDILVLSGKLLGRNGAVIFEGNVEELDDIGYGYLKVTAAGCTRIVHKSGFVIGADCCIDARLPGGKFVALQTSGGWVMYTLTGRLLVDNVWEDVAESGGIIVLKKGGKSWLITPDYLVMNADSATLKLSAGFDDVRSWPGNLIWVRQGQKEGLFDARLNIKIPVDEHSLKNDFFGITATSRKGIRIYDSQFSESGYFQQLKVNKQWMAIRQENKWRLFDPFQRKPLSAGYDTLEFIGLFPAGYKGDSVKVFFNKEKSLDFHKVKLGFIPAKDSTSYLLVTEGEKRSVYDLLGTKLFSVNYDNVQYAEEGIFIVSKNEKKGLVNSKGELLLPLEMDAIGDMSGGIVPLLKGMKFGVLDTRNKKQIKPTYDKNLVLYNDQFLIAYKNGAYGFADWHNKPHTPFEFDEIMQWSAGTAFVRKKSQWQHIDVNTKTVLMDNIRKITIVNDDGQEKTAIIQQGNLYGVISSTKGAIIPVTFSDIINIGSHEEPLYFTEKHVEEAALFVVIYYDKEGKLIYRQALEAEDYERVYCSE